MPSRRPLRSLSGFEMVLHGFTCVRLSARLCRRYGGASGRAEQGATGWGRGGSSCPHCVRDDYGGQRERSRIARAAVPYCPAPDGPSCRSSADWKAGRPLRPSALVDSELSTSRQTPLEHISGSGPARADWRPCSGRPAALLRRPFGAPVSCPRGSSSPRSTSARVGAFRTLRPTPLRLPSRLSADHQTARGQPRHRQGVRELWWTGKPSTSLTDAE